MNTTPTLTVRHTTRIDVLVARESRYGNVLQPIPSPCTQLTLEDTVATLTGSCVTVTFDEDIIGIFDTTDGYTDTEGAVWVRGDQNADTVGRVVDAWAAMWAGI